MIKTFAKRVLRVKLASKLCKLIVYGVFFFVVCLYSGINNLLPIVYST